MHEILFIQQSPTELKEEIYFAWRLGVH
ncbi:hypothetical protein Q3P62_000002 [Salmonella enterica]|nr:hypothetical protein [Salmonella enterica]